MTLTDLVDNVRKLIDDTTEEYRWPTVNICKYLSDAVVRLNNCRPESLYVNGRLTETTFPPNVAYWEMPEEYKRWHVAFIYYAAARCLEEDSADTQNRELANDYMSKAEARFMA